MIQRILEAGQRKTFYYVRIRDQGYKLSKLFFLLNRALFVDDLPV